MTLLYNLLSLLLLPIWIPWMWLRAARRKDRPIWSERFGALGRFEDRGTGVIWLHAVSVGEVIAALPILTELRTLAPGVRILLTVTTSSGYRTARERTGELVDRISYFPVDLLPVISRAVRNVRPDVVAVMETELWLNFLRSARHNGAVTLLLNGRISDRSYPRALRLRAFYRALLAHLDQALMQTDLDARRIRSLGAREVRVFGNCKYDQAVPEQAERDWRTELKLPPGLPVLVIGSTRGEDEESFVLSALRTVGFERFACVHAPRHLERASALLGAARAAGADAVLRSEGEPGSYVILDTYGELAAIYAVADIAIVGGGFGSYGGQNPVQPMAHGKPVLFGPNMHNFAEVARQAIEAGAAIVCAEPHELGRQTRLLLADESMRASMGREGRRIVEANMGASHRYAAAVAEALKSTARR